MATSLLSGLLIGAELLVAVFLLCIFALETRLPLLEAGSLHLPGVAPLDFSPRNRANQQAHRMGALIEMLGGAELADAVLMRYTIGSRYSGGLIYAMPAEVTVE